jgi:CheY-like chemotaxis protein
MFPDSTQPVTAMLPSVLIVENDPDTRALYQAVFHPFAHVVEASEDGAEALGKAICRRPSVVVTDTRLPRIDGFALCRLLRTDPATRDSAIIIVTSVKMPTEEIRAITAGADRVLVKPCPPEDLVAAALELCGRHESHPGTPGESTLAVVPTPTSDAARSGPARSHSYRRASTTRPPAEPPALRCPRCDSRLVYEHSHIGGVSDRFPEQWDYFKCESCGPYQYRHRTRKLKTA